MIDVLARVQRTLAQVLDLPVDRVRPDTRPPAFRRIEILEVS